MKLIVRIASLLALTMALFNPFINITPAAAAPLAQTEEEVATSASATITLPAKPSNPNMPTTQSVETAQLRVELHFWWSGDKALKIQPRVFLEGGDLVDTDRVNILWKMWGTRDGAEISNTRREGTNQIQPGENRITDAELINGLVKDGNVVHFEWQTSDGQNLPPVNYTFHRAGQVRLSVTQPTPCTVRFRYVIDPWLVATINGVQMAPEHLTDPEGYSATYDLPTDVKDVAVSAIVYSDKALSKKIGELDSVVPNGCYTPPPTYTLTAKGTTDCYVWSTTATATPDGATIKYTPAQNGSWNDGETQKIVTVTATWPNGETRTTTVTIDRPTDCDTPKEEPKSPEATPEFTMVCRATDTNGHYAVQTSGRIADTKNSDAYRIVFGDDPTLTMGPDHPNTEQTEWLTMDDTYARTFVLAPPINEGRYLHGVLVKGGLPRWWPETSTQYNKDKVLERRFGWQFSGYVIADGRIYRFDWEPLSFPSLQWLIDQGCIQHTDTPDEPHTPDSPKTPDEPHTPDSPKTPDVPIDSPACIPANPADWKQNSDGTFYDPVCGLPHTAGEEDMMPTMQLIAIAIVMLLIGFTFLRRAHTSA